MHAIVSSNPCQPTCHHGNFLKGKTLGERAVLQALNDCQSSDTHDQVLQDSADFGRQPYLGVMLGSTAIPGPGHRGRVTVRGVGSSLAPPPWCRGLQGASTLWGGCSMVLIGAALWYLKRGYPLYVHFINGEYTEGDSYLRIKL